MLVTRHRLENTQSTLVLLQAFSSALVKWEIRCAWPQEGWALLRERAQRETEEGSLGR